MFIRQNNQDIHDPEAIRALCGPCGIETGEWHVAALTAESARQAATDGATQQAVLDRFRDALEALKTQNGYLTEDIVCLSPETPNLEEILAKFDKSHHHTDDEVRIVLAGAGVFGIEPENAAPFEIHMAPGDMINVPAYTRHWFTLTETRHIVAIRVFKTPAGWTAIYAPESAIA